MEELPVKAEINTVTNCIKRQKKCHFITNEWWNVIFYEKFYVKMNKLSHEP